MFAPRRGWASSGHDWWAEVGMLVGRVVGGLVGRLVTRRRLHGKISRDGDSKGEAKEVGSRMQLRRFMLLGQLALALLEAGEAGA